MPGVTAEWWAAVQAQIRQDMGGLNPTPAWTATGEDAYDNFGRAVGTAGDVNGDGYADVIVGADYYGNFGKVYVYHGSAAGLSATPAWTATGEGAGDYFGGVVGTAGDVNGDGYADVIVGYTLNDDGGTDAGKAYVYHGSAGLRPSPDRCLSQRPLVRRDGRDTDLHRQPPAK